MNEAVRIGFLKAHTGLPLLTLMLVLYKIHGQNTSRAAPAGCIYDSDSVMWICDFKTWIPPLQDEDFGLAPWYYLELNNINGNIPAGAFSGLNGPDTSSIDTHFYWYCYDRNTTLTRDIFTSNLHWLIQLEIQNCYLKNGLPSRLLENLKGLRYLRIKNGGIEPLLAHDALAGLTNLRQIIVYAYIFDGILPAGFFNALNNLTQIDLRFSKLTSIPPDLLNGLVSLEEIYLSFNNLQTLPPGLFRDLISLRVINLQRNPWNCSCDLTWFLPWSDITVGAVCQSPAEVNNERFEDAFGLLGCIPSTYTSLSTALPSESKITETQTLFFPTFTEISSTTETSSQMELRTLTAILAGSYATPVTAIATLMTSAATASFRTTTESVVASTISSTATAEVKRGATNTLQFSSSYSVSSIFAQSSYSILPRVDISHNKGNDDDGFKNSLRNIILVSTVGALLVLLVTGTIFFRNRCRKNCVVIGNVLPMNNDEEDAKIPDSRDTDCSSSSTTNIKTE